ncbi:MAG: tetratricopeptide repeat protein, partial [Planctomycetota bacterium]
LAKIAIKQGNTESSIEYLNSAIKKDPASFEADIAKNILAQQGGQYIPGIDAELTMQMLQSELNMPVIPQFVTPQDIISVNINVRGSRFSYGTALDGYIAITNNSSQPVIISDNSLFQGNVRIDATITGDINMKIHNLIKKKVLPSSPIQPNRNLLIPLQLSTGQLKDILKTYPQASLEIEFTAYIDPVTDFNGTVSNNLKQIVPASVMVSRTGIDLTRRYLQNRFDTMSTGRYGQKMQTAQLFIGLLQEKNAMVNQPASYKFMYADWMPELLKSAITESLSDRDWTVKSNTMAEMLSLGLDYELTNAVAGNLNDTQWPVRFMALYLLAKNQGSEFTKVLDWHAEYDTNIIVRDMAIALGGKKPQPQIEPAPEPKQMPQQETSLDSYLENVLEESRRIGPPSTTPTEPVQAPQQ